MDRNKTRNPSKIRHHIGKGLHRLTPSRLDMAFEVLASGERASEVDVKIELYRMNRCWYCGLPLKRHCSRRDPRLRTEDHQIPKSKGGEDKPYNKVLACRKCNEEKGKRNVQQYREFLGVDEFWGEKFAKEIRRKLDGAI